MTPHWRIYRYEYYAPNNSRRVSTVRPKFNPAWFPEPVTAKVAKKDLVQRGDGYGIVLYINHELEEAGVLFFATREVEAVDLNNFVDYTHRGYRRMWELEV
jgi:hypothetical protein